MSLVLGALHLSVLSAALNAWVAGISRVILVVLLKSLTNGSALATTP